MRPTTSGSTTSRSAATETRQGDSFEGDVLGVGPSDAGVPQRRALRLFCYQDE
jgi:hypothetical protein